jgi:hypothetical protein
MVQFLTGVTVLSLLQTVQISSGATQPPIQWVLVVLGVLSPGVEWAGHDVDHSFPSSAEVRNEWNCIATPTILHGVHRDNFSFMHSDTTPQCARLQGVH